jgi:hypothetical protein
MPDIKKSLILIHRAFLNYKQSPTNAQTINKGIN